MNENRTFSSSIQAFQSLTRLGEGASRSLSLLLLRRLPPRLTTQDVAAGKAQ